MVAGVDWSLAGGIEILPPSLRSRAPPVDTPSTESSPSLASSDDEGDAANSSGASSSSPSRQTKQHQQQPVDKTDWLWALTEEPHRSRRKAILAAHPEVSKLMGHEPLTKYVVLAVVSLQLACAYLVRDTHPLSWRSLLLAYVVGATANQNLFLAIHEITHNLAFRGIRANRLFAVFANLPIGVPYAMLFKRYHIEHHKHLGEDGIDTDLPTRFELLCLQNVFGKAFFCTFQILFYALRPGFVRAQRFTAWHAFNFAVQFAFDFAVYRALGGYALSYLVMSSFLAGSLHPCAAHFIAEHYVFEASGQETSSYYGPLNALTYNVGYHNEHHDFPAVPWTRLPALHAAAPEFYDELAAHPSWPMVTLRFIFDGDVGLFSRVKRPAKESRHQQAAAALVVEQEGGKGALGGIMD